MKSILNSIKIRLFLWFFSLTSTLLIVLGVFFYHELKKAIFKSVDNTLHSKMQILKGLLHEEHGEIELEVTEIVLGEYAIPRSGHYYKVIMDGEILAASPSLVDNNFNLASGRLEFYDEQTKERIYTSMGPGKEPIRVFQHDFEFLGRPVTAFAAESLKGSVTLIKRVKLFLLVVIPISLLIIGLIGLWIGRQSLLPLRLFSSKIEKITYRTLDERIDPESQAKEIKGIAVSFNDMLDRLQKAFETEKRIISDASHELKTPVSVIKAQCDVILQKVRMKEEYIDALKTIRMSAEDMKNLINSLLSLARLDSGLLKSSDFKVISLNDCLKKAIQLVEILAQEQRVSIKTAFNDDINIIGNQEKLTEAFVNIIDNAIAYNKNEGSVEIEASENAESVEVRIKDTGRGIKEKDLERIFERFYRVDVSRSSGGTGLGLSIAKAIIEAHSGQIMAKSEMSKGSCFIVTLPIKHGHP